MVTHFSNDADQLRAEIAATAARMIAENGADYSTAKRKAARQILGNGKTRSDTLPDNAQIEEEVRRHHALFFGESQPARLRYLRQLALRLMAELAAFQPHLVGAVLNGTAGAHADIHLHLFADSPKDVEIFLLNKHIDFDVSEAPPANPRREPVEILSFLWQQEGVHLHLYQPDDLRHLPKTTNTADNARADAGKLATLIAESDTP
ncbi:MAG: hypothetical protein JSS58_04530 [Proteobacteria bacterium]|nr:hypothetical protein [Pseudomonadota bacterium]